MKSLNEIVAELRMGDDGGKPAYRIGRADKVEVSMPSGTPVRSYVIECVTIKELADWIEAAVAREREPGNAAAIRAALELALDALISWLNGTIDRTTNRETIKAIRAALTVPARQCDVGTAEEQAERFGKLCGKYYNEEETCNEECPLASHPIIHGFPRCQAYWAQTPYEEKGAGNDK